MNESNFMLVGFDAPLMLCRSKKVTPVHKKNRAVHENKPQKSANRFLYIESLDLNCQPMKIHILSGILFFLISACNKPVENEQALLATKLAESFEARWSVPGPASDSVRNALASLSIRNEYTLYSRAWQLAGKGNLPAALKTVDSLVMGFPGFVKGTYLRANLRLENKDTIGSLSDFERCLKRNPAFFECRMNRGSLFFSKNMPDLAFKDFKEAVKLQPANPEARLNLGNAQFALGQLDSACIQWQFASKSGNSSAATLSEKFCPSPKK